MTVKIYVEGYGCTLNSADTMIIENSIKEFKDFQIIDKDEDADIVVINTCIVRLETEHKMISRIKYLRSLNKKVVVSAHMVPDSMEDSLNLPRFIKSIFYKYMIKFYKNADKCVVVNSYYKNELIRLGLSPKKIEFIPNIADKELFYNKNNKEDLRKKYNIDNNKFVVVGSGQVQKRKGNL